MQTVTGNATSSLAASRIEVSIRHEISMQLLALALFRHLCHKSWGFCSICRTRVNCHLYQWHSIVLYKQLTVFTSLVHKILHLFW